MKVVKLFPRKNSLFHFGNNSMDNSDVIFGSDSLVSALACNHSENKGGNVKEFLDNMPPVSSLFIGLKFGEKEILFVPKPVNFNFSDEVVDSDRKLPKKVKFISIKIYKKFLEGKIFTKDDFIRISKDFLVANDEVSDVEDMKLYHKVIRERNKISREKGTTDENSLYNMESIKLGYQSKGIKAFFYFFIEGEISEDLNSAIKLIKINGLGGDRSVGHGRIDRINIEDFDEISSINREKKGMSLSRFIVPKEEIDKVIYYNLVKISGFVNNNSLKRKNVYAFDTGSISYSDVEGKIIDLSPDNSNTVCYRFLKPLFIPVGDKDE